MAKKLGRISLGNFYELENEVQVRGWKDSENLAHSRYVLITYSFYLDETAMFVTDETGEPTSRTEVISWRGRRSDEEMLKFVEGNDAFRPGT